MDNLITGLIAVAIFLAFVIGLAVSIGSIPFSIIIGLVSVMMLVDFYESIKEGFQQDNK
jgi:nitrogen fixation-related uncharacterized protein